MAAAAAATLAALLLTTSPAVAATAADAPGAVSVGESLSPCDWALVSTVCGLVGGAVGGVAGGIAGDVTKGVTGWVADAAASVLQATLDLANSSFTPDLSSGAVAGYLQRMSGLAAATGVLWLLLVVVQAVVSASPGVLLDGVKRLAIAAIATSGIVWGTQVLLRVADEMTAVVVGDRLTGDAGAFLTNLGGNFHAAIDTGQTSLFLVAAAAVLTVLVGLLLFIELAVRAAAVDLAAVFLPLLLVASVWSPAAHASRRLIGVLITAIFSKFAIFVALGLAVGLFAGGTTTSSGMTPASWVVSPIAAQSAAHPAQSIGPFVIGVVLLLLAALAPMALLSFVGHAPEAVASVAAIRRGGGVAVAKTGVRALHTTAALAGGAAGGGVSILMGGRTAATRGSSAGGGTGASGGQAGRARSSVVAANATAGARRVSGDGRPTPALIGARAPRKPRDGGDAA